MTKPRAKPNPGNCPLKLDTLREKDDPLYCPPSWRDIRDVKKHFNLTGTAISHIVGVNARQVRKYISNPDVVGANSHHQMPYAQWRMLLIATKIVTPPSI